jgi:hypothetical protein
MEAEKEAEGREREIILQRMRVGASLHLSHVFPIFPPYLDRPTHVPASLDAGETRQAGGMGVSRRGREKKRWEVRLRGLGGPG